MFSTLRNKLLFLNLSITSGVIIAAFAFVYFIAYSNLQADIRQRLHTQPETQIQVGPDNPNQPSGQNGSPTTVRHRFADDISTFHVEVDEDGRIVRIESAVNLPESAYQQLVEIAWKNQDENEMIKLEDREWRYSVAPIRVQVVGEDGIPQAVNDQNYSLIFLDVTEMNSTLNQLLMTLLFVGISTLIVILGVSFYFANRAIKPIQGAWEKQKQFVADASHELKTPLSIIHANCDALVASQEDTIQNQMKWIDYIRAGTDRMGKLVQDLLILAKTDDERITLHKEHFNLSEVVDTVSQSMEAAIASKRLSLTRSIEPDLIVSGDPDGVSQVVGILLDNAIKYASPGGWIRLSLTRSGRRIEFSITNNGRGIAKEDLPKVFDRFFRADRSRTYKDGSYGLGLSIAQSIIKQHASVIKVRSVENQATTFSFSLAK
ncbi:sensor histidine kinase [Paenibacillus sp. FSL K6-2441]|uniref:sensor histidine kinase n=1 Tax=Paenibacillus TaxID=44249 RepID=UPI0030DC8A66